MKKLADLILLSTLLLSFGSCGKNTNQNDLEKMNLKGEVVLIKDGGEYIFFNDKGNIIKKYNDYRLENLTIQNYYYIDNRLSKTKYLVKSNINNNISNYDIQETFNYDDDGKLISSVGQSDKGGSWNTFHFYQKGKLVKDSTQQQFIGFLSTRVDTYIYKGESLIRRNYNEKYKGETNSTSSIISFYENGLEIKTINDDNTTLTYEYEFDMKGNWVKQIKSNGEVWKREIFYKGDDISLYENKFEELKKVISSSSLETENNQAPIINNEIVPEENNIQSNNTSQQQEKRKCSSCNGTGQCPKCSKPQRVRYKQGESPSDHNEIRLGMIVCTQCGGNLMNFGADKNKSCYLCKASGWLYCPECNNSGNGSNIGKCQRCKGTGFDN